MKRSQLKYKNENLGGITYRGHIALLENPKSADCVVEVKEFYSFDTVDPVIVFYDFETGGFNMNRHDILQICFKFAKKIFSFCITSIKCIDPRASQINHLTKVRKKLFKNGIEVPPLSKQNVMTKLVDVLKSVGSKCLFVAHNDKFDAPRFVHAIKESGLEEQLNSWIDGFSDYQVIFWKGFADLSSHKLEFLATAKLSISCEEAHDAKFDVVVLEKLAH